MNGQIVEWFEKQIELATEMKSYATLLVLKEGQKLLLEEPKYSDEEVELLVRAQREEGLPRCEVCGEVLGPNQEYICNMCRLEG